ncbi:MAG: dihydropteroate synthase [Candidatus Zixiibacteriota bacterium]|jgi:dihydropteroate synthase
MTDDNDGSITVRSVWFDSPAQARALMAEIGVAPAGVDIMAAKFSARAVRVTNIHPAAANIVKQVALSSGAEAAVHRDAVVCRVPQSDALLFGTAAQLGLVARKLDGQAFGLTELGKGIARAVASWEAVPELTLRGEAITLERSLVMGIVNVTPDSFSDGGAFAAPEAAAAHARRLRDQGADIVDVGGESSRPGSAYVSEEEELGRVMPVLEAVAEDFPVSVDTRRAAVARRAAEVGAAMVNDISAGRDDPAIAEVCAEFALPYVVMHMRGTPADMQDDPTYGDVVAEVRDFLAARAEWATAQGVAQVLIDPGIGFGKTLEHNLKLLNNIPALADLGYPVVIGHSRKAFIGILTGAEVEGRLGGSLGAALAAAGRGAHVLRVHDVAETAQALAVAAAVSGA